jgi:hypothetical protein
MQIQWIVARIRCDSCANGFEVRLDIRTEADIEGAAEIAVAQGTHVVGTRSRSSFSEDGDALCPTCTTLKAAA